MRRFGLFLLMAVPLATAPALGATQLLGPTPYLSFDDSPFQGLPLAAFQLEDFEDHVLDVPGVTTSEGIISTALFSGSIIDSVDGDDGNPADGICTGCDSWFSGPNRGNPVRWVFSPGPTGTLPTHVGIVWTDGEHPTFFEAFDENGDSLGVIGPIDLTDGSIFGGTAEDRFFGVIHSGGVSAIELGTLDRGVEMDHLQFGYGCPGDADGDGFASPANPACFGGPAEDCDDTDPAVFPGAVELCDGIDNNCDGQTDEVNLILQADVSISPTSLNVNSQGNIFTADLHLVNVCDPANPQAIDGNLLDRTYVSQAGSTLLADPLTLLCPRPGGDTAFERGIVDNENSRGVTGQSIGLKFNLPPDGDCRTLGGDRQDLIAILAGELDNAVVPVCIAGTVQGEPFEACTSVTVRNRGNR